MNNKPDRRICGSSGKAALRPGGFTIIELMAVVLIIVVLAGVTLNVVNFIQERATHQFARAQLAALETALENYKGDWGFYPATLPGRFSNDGFTESTNNWLLYRALVGDCHNCTKKYLSIPAAQVVRSTANVNVYTIRDPWGTPYNFYNSPRTTYRVDSSMPSNWPVGIIYYGGIAFGGQHNIQSYDLCSLGADRSTYLAGVPTNPLSPTNYAWHNGPMWSNSGTRRDDITNWGAGR